MACFFNMSCVLMCDVCMDGGEGGGGHFYSVRPVQCTSGVEVPWGRTSCLQVTFRIQGFLDIMSRVPLQSTGHSSQDLLYIVRYF
jgi:hypothetical protein